MINKVKEITKNPTKPARPDWLKTLLLLIAQLHFFSGDNK